MSHAFLNTFFCLPFVQWVESLPPVCPRTWLAPFPQTSALMSTPSSHWTIWKSTHWRLMACTCSMTRTWSLLTQPQRTRFASTGSNGSTRTGGVNAAALGGEQISGGHWFRQTDRQLDANRHNQRNIIAGKRIDCCQPPFSSEPEDGLWHLSYGMTPVHFFLLMTHPFLI